MSPQLTQELPLEGTLRRPAFPLNITHAREHRSALCLLEAVLPEKEARVWSLEPSLRAPKRQEQKTSSLSHTLDSNC